MYLVMPGRLSMLGLQPRHAFSGEELRKPHFTAPIHHPLDPVGKLTHLWKMNENEPFTLYSDHFLLIKFPWPFSIAKCLMTLPQGSRPPDRDLAVSHNRGLVGRMTVSCKAPFAPWRIMAIRSVMEHAEHDHGCGNPWKKPSPIDEVDCWV